MKDHKIPITLSIRQPQNSPTSQRTHPLEKSPSNIDEGMILLMKMKNHVEYDLELPKE
jgi:hypothetical protein